ncbi:MAG: PAS domain S-box protein [Promethearchaeota archaeon]
MANVGIDKEFSTLLSNEQFLHFANNSRMGVVIIQRGYLKYYNQKFMEIFGYSKEEVANWKKREFYKIVHPEDLSYLVKYFKLEDDKKTLVVKFRGIRKDKRVIEIENYICNIKYNDMTAYLSSYVSLEGSYLLKTAKLTTRKLLRLDYAPKTLKLLKENNISFTIIDNLSYREEV